MSVCCLLTVWTLEGAGTRGVTGVPAVLAVMVWVQAGSEPYEGWRCRPKSHGRADGSSAVHELHRWARPAARLRLIVHAGGKMHDIAIVGRVLTGIDPRIGLLRGLTV